MADQKLVAATVAGVGVLFLWSALRGKQVLSVAQKTIQGQPGTSATSDPTATGGGNIQTAGASAYTGTAPVPTNSSQKAFFVAVLAGIGAPPTTANINSMVAWAQHESVWPGGPNKGGMYNPFNTTLGGFPGETIYNSVGVKNYPTPVEGVAATVATLLAGYPNICSDLRSGRGLCGQSNAAGEFAKWSDNGYTSVC